MIHDSSSKASSFFFVDQEGGHIVERRVQPSPKLQKQSRNKASRAPARQAVGETAEKGRREDSALFFQTFQRIFYFFCFQAIFSVGDRAFLHTLRLKSRFAR